MKRSDRIIIRMERAGGSLSEAGQLLAEAGPEAAPIANSVANINIMVSDIRSAIIKLQRGEDMATVAQELEDSWRNLWPISAEISPAERRAQR